MGAPAHQPVCHILFSAPLTDPNLIEARTPRSKDSPFNFAPPKAPERHNPVRYRGREMNSRTGRKAVACTALLLCALAGGAAGQRLTLFGSENTQPVREVATCAELKAALVEKVLSVLVAGDITCTRAAWGSPVRINWNVEIFGREPTEAGQLMPVLDWTDVRKGLVVQKGAVLYIHTLQVRQNSMGIGGIDFAFIETSKGATGVFTGVVVGVRSCPQPVVAYNEIAGAIPRPHFLIGQQRTSTLGDTTLLVEDIAIWWPEINSLWQICHAAFLCGEDLRVRSAILGAQNAIAHTTCMAKPTADWIRHGDRPESASKPMLEMLAVGATLVGVLLAVCVGFFYCRRSCSKVRVQDTPQKEYGEENPIDKVPVDKA